MLKPLLHGLRRSAIEGVFRTDRDVVDVATAS
jgi:hypothetical protein